MKTLITSLLTATEQSLIQSRSIKRAFCSRRRNGESQIRSGGIADPLASYPRRNYFCPQRQPPPSLSLSLSSSSARRISAMKVPSSNKVRPRMWNRNGRCSGRKSPPRVNTPMRGNGNARTRKEREHRREREGRGKSRGFPRAEITRRRIENERRMEQTREESRAIDKTSRRQRQEGGSSDDLGNS